MRTLKTVTLVLAVLIIVSAISCKRTVECNCSDACADNDASSDADTDTDTDNDTDTDTDTDSDTDTDVDADADADADASGDVDADADADADVEPYRCDLGGKCDDEIDCTDDLCRPDAGTADDAGCVYIPEDDNCGDFFICKSDAGCIRDYVYVDCNLAKSGSGTELDPYSTITEAINNLEPDSRKSVMVFESYCGDFFVMKGKKVRIEGETITTSMGHIFLDGGTLELETMSVDFGSGDGIRCENFAVCMLNNVHVHDNSGTGVNVSNSSADIYGSHVYGNDKGIAADESTVNIRRCRIHHNEGGGMSLVNSKYEVENCIIHDNGNDDKHKASAFGGVYLKWPQSGSYFRFNTVTDNETSHGYGGGIMCDSVSIPVSNSILWCNALPDQNGGCILDNCISQSDGDDNPLLDQTERLTDASVSAIDQGNNADAPAVDFDGESRPWPAGGKVDIGADEYHP